MKLWNKIKLFFNKQAESEAKMEVFNFIMEEPFYRGPFGKFPDGLKRYKERQAYKQDLIATYVYQKGDDLLAKKQDFIDQYTVNEQEQLRYFIFEYNCLNSARCKAWRDHEQVERREAQKAWRVVAKRNYHEHMRAKYMNQKSGYGG